MPLKKRRRNNHDQDDKDRAAIYYGGIPFDTPDAIFIRYHNMSTLESLLKHYKLKDPKLIYIGKIIHDIAVNIWEKRAFKKTLIIQDAVNKII